MQGSLHKCIFLALGMLLQGCALEEPEYQWQLTFSLGDWKNLLFHTSLSAGHPGFYGGNKLCAPDKF